MSDIHDHPLNLAIDRMLDADRTSLADDLLSKVREMCANVPIADLRVAISVHRANCHQPSCPVLAAMEEADVNHVDESIARAKHPKEVP